MKITVQIRDVYGKPTCYPVDEAAKYFAEIAGTKTLTPQAVRLIRALGVQVDVVDMFGAVAATMV